MLRDASATRWPALRTVRLHIGTPALIGAGTGALGITVLAAAWSQSAAGSLAHTNLASLSAALPLTAAIAAAYRFPIYIRHNTKICVFTVPVYLLAVFLPPAIAATAAGLGILTGEWSVRSRHGNQLSDIAIHTGRWIVVVWLGSLLAHLSLPGPPGLGSRALLWTATAVVLLLGDLLTLPLAIAPVTHERIDRIVLTCLRGGGEVEAAQYAVGVTGALIASWHAEALVLLVVPCVLLYLLNRKEADPETFQLVESMADAVDLRDPYTVGHSRRVVEVTKRILAALGRDGQEAELILTAARVHDIGKTIVPDAILLKHGDLTHEDRAAMEAHAEHGAQLLAHYPDLERIVNMVRHHHERWDGTGYPCELRETAIPFGARIIAVADAFVAMISDRSYRPSLSLDRVAEILRDGRGRQWDPQIVDALLRSLEERPEATQAGTSGWSGRDLPEAAGAAATA